MFSRAMFLLSVVIAPVLPLHAQSDSAELLKRAIVKMRDTLDRLPNYLCTQTVDRSEAWPGSGGCNWWPPPEGSAEVKTDRARFDVLSTSGGEFYSWAGENRFQNQDLAGIVRLRTLSTGNAGRLLRSILGGSTAFVYRGEVAENGRKLRGYGFRVPRSVSEYWFGTVAGREVVPCEGIILVDSDTADLVRLAVNSAEPPERSGACRAVTTLRYGLTRLNESEFLAPTNRLFEFVGTRGQEIRNSSVYSGCHEVRGEPGNPPDQPALALPEGLPFSIAFTADISYRTAAAGDTIAAKLITPIQDSSKRILVPAGTAVVARILVADFTNSRRFQSVVGIAHLIFRLESLTIDGVARPFVATTAQPVESADPMEHEPKSRVNKEISVDIYDRDVSVFLLAPNIAMFSLFDVKPASVLKAGKQSAWKTGGTGPTESCLSGARPCQ